MVDPLGSAIVVTRGPRGLRAYCVVLVSLTERLQVLLKKTPRRFARWQTALRLASP